VFFKRICGLMDWWIGGNTKILLIRHGELSALFGKGGINPLIH